MSLHLSDRRRFARAIAAPLLLAALVGCASSGGAAPAAGAGDEAALKQRAQTFWNLVRANDNVGAWAYEAASKEPNAKLEEYLKKGGFVYKVADVRSVKSINGDTAILEMWMEYDVPLLRLKDRKHASEDQWRLINGVWYHSPKRSALFPGRPPVATEQQTK